MMHIRKRKSHSTRHPLFAILVCLIFLCACQPEYEARPTRIPTSASTPTPTHTFTLVPTITPKASLTPTMTRTFYPSLTPTRTATPVTPWPAKLIDFEDSYGKVVDWGYFYVTDIGFDSDAEVNQLSAMISFRLMDRAIHQRNMHFLGQDITVYYLHVSHDFKDEQIAMALIIGGTYGKDVLINLIPADGSAYLQVRLMTADEPFDPYVIHRDANLPFEQRQKQYPDIGLTEFQALLLSLPDELIILADHPILFPRNDWQQIKV
ncbi:MAG: hypothetical protein ABIG43_00375, partial [Chloroflexota bacterium]